MECLLVMTCAMLAVTTQTEMRSTVLTMVGYAVWLPIPTQNPECVRSLLWRIEVLGKYDILMKIVDTTCILNLSCNSFVVQITRNFFLTANLLPVMQPRKEVVSRIGELHWQVQDIFLAVQLIYLSLHYCQVFMDRHKNPGGRASDEMLVTTSLSTMSVTPDSISSSYSISWM
jgi:hypothetical protein